MKRHIFTAAWDNWVSRGYLLLVTASVALASYDTRFVEHADASLAWVWAIFTTAPVSLPALAVLPERLIPAPEPFFAGCAYVIASGIGLLVRATRSRPAGPRLNWNS